MVEYASIFGSWVKGSLRVLTRGSRVYWMWMGLLAVCFLAGAFAYWRQLDQGLITTSLRDQVSWGFYIGNFNFLVGVADAAVVMIVAAFLYQWKPIKEVVVYSMMLAIAALVCCVLFVLVDVGRPERLWHLIPGVGILNLPDSMLAWDVVWLNGFLLLNLVIVTYLLFNLYRNKTPNRKVYMPMVWASIPVAVIVHAVTAFLYAALVARPYWNSAILAPRFIVSALCSGPAVMIILFQVLQATTRFHIRREAVWKVAELMAYFMGFNLFLLGSEIVKEIYSDTEHLIHLKYMFIGVEGHDTLVPWMWLAVACSTVSFLLFLVPAWRRNRVLLNIGCVLIFVGVLLEKSVGMVIPGMTPDPLGEIYEYAPSWNEIMVAIGIMALGALIFTAMVKVATAILQGDLRHPGTAPEGGAASEPSLG